jgi:hypothetical protein
VFEHDAGWWVQHPAAVADLANWLASQMNTPLPVISGLDIHPDPRLQLGDVVFVQDNAMTGLYLKVLVTSITLGFDVNAGMSMSLGCRVLEVTTQSATYADADRQLAGSSYTAVDSGRKSKTYQQIDATPLA